MLYFLKSRKQVQQEPEPQSVQQEPEPEPQSVQQLTEDDIKFWKEKNQDPKTEERIEPSIVSTSPYVKLYKESIKILISIRLLKSSSRILTIEDCKYIRKSLPDAHVCKNNGLYYDHLFTKYFLKKIKTYDEKYRAYGTDIYLYLELYSILIRKQDIIIPDMSTKRMALKPLPPDIIDAILQRQPQLFRQSVSLQFKEDVSSQFKEDVSQNDILTNNIDRSLFMKSDLSIDKVMKRLYNDIINILNHNFTKENYSHVINNFTILKFVEKIYKISDNLNTKLAEYIKKYINEGTDVNYFFRTHLVNKESSDYFLILEDIYNKIILLYDYSFPDFIHDGIYETNCIGTVDAATLDEFNYDTNNHLGKVTIIQYYTKDKIYNKCYLTETLFSILLQDINTYAESYKFMNFKLSVNPSNRQPFTEGDINNIVDQLLINLINYNEDEFIKGLDFLKVIFKSELVKIKNTLDYVIGEEASSLKKIETLFEKFLKEIDYSYKEIYYSYSYILKNLLNDPNFNYFKRVNREVANQEVAYPIFNKMTSLFSKKKKLAFIYKKNNIQYFTEGDIKDFTEGDIKDFTEGDIDDIIIRIIIRSNGHIYNEEQSRNCLNLLLKIFISQYDKVNKKLKKLKKLKESNKLIELNKLNEILANLIVTINEKLDEKLIQIKLKKIYYYILKNEYFINFLGLIKRVNKNIAEQIKREPINPDKIYEFFLTYNGGRKKRIVSNKKRSSKKTI
jgi:hypothetical protein